MSTNKPLTVYRASAGSGKTFTLTAEYISRLLATENAEHPHILAVTFTNKATAEMKMRILLELWNLAHDKSGGFREEIHKRLPLLTDKEITQRANEALTAIIHKYEDFHVETIDTFFRSLLTSLAHELGLSAACGVEINDKQVVNDAVERLINLLQEDKELQKWVMDYIHQRIDDDNRWDMTEEVKDLARNVMKEEYLLREEDLLKVINDANALKEYSKKLRSIIEHSKKELKEKAGTFNEAVEEQLGYENISYKNRLQGYVQKLLSGNAEPPSESVLKYAHADEDELPQIWLKKEGRKDPDKVKAASTLRQQFSRLNETVRKIYSDINSCELTLRFLNPLRLIGRISLYIEDINKENNRFMLAKTPLLFDKLVGNDDAPFVLEKAGIQFHHIMIDEFQDTSPLQWSNFEKLIAESIATGGNCMVVGDVKQGIYRFRGGDWKLLAHIDKRYGTDRTHLLTLDTNYRSCEEIIHFNNQLFTTAARLLDKKNDTGEETQTLYADVMQKCSGKTGGKVEIHFIPKETGKKGKAGIPDKKKKEEPEEAEELLAQKIVELHANGTEYNDMVILVRFNREARKLTDYFSTRHNEIPLVSDEAFVLSASPAVRLLVHTIRYISTLNGRKHEKPNEVSRAFIAKAYIRLHPDSSAKFADIARELPQEIEDKFMEIGKQTLYELCESLIQYYGLFKDENEAPYLECFLDEIINCVDSGVTSLHAFLDTWDERLVDRAIPGGKSDGVRIVSIHKSKGLDFPIVLMPYCDWDIEKGHRSEILWCEPQDPPYDALPLVPIRPKKEMEYSTYSLAYQAEHNDRRTENLNLLYVAFTRAVRGLYVWAKYTEGKEELKKGSTGSSCNTIGDLLYECCGQNDINLGHAIPSSSRKGKSQEEEENPLVFIPKEEPIIFESYPKRAVFRQSNPATDFVTGRENTDKDAREEGTMLHHILSFIYTEKDVDKTFRMLEAQGIWSSKEEEARHKEMLLRYITLPETRSWFDGTWNVINESELLSIDEKGTIFRDRPDRVMSKDGETIVVDYKFGEPHKKYVRQVKRYCRLLQQSGCRNVKGYLWYMGTADSESKIVDVEYQNELPFASTITPVTQ